jgi:hypothetical protein
MSILAAWPAALPAGVPVDPDAEEATRWILEELAKPEYQAAKPSWFDILSEAFWNWLQSLTIDTGGAAQGPLLLGLVIVVAAALVAAFLVFGAPRLGRRSRAGAALFEEGETRTAEQLRRSAARAAGEGRWAEAIEELFRAMARSLEERVLVATTPGTTAREFTTAAGRVFSAQAPRLSRAGEIFDSVRYLERPGTEADYAALLALEKELRAARPDAGANGEVGSEETASAESAPHPRGPQR